MKNNNKFSQNRFSREPRKTAKTGWNELASWYTGWAGSGSKFHKKFGIPQVMDFINISPGVRVLDIGCGVGALREAVEQKKGLYVGIDKSMRMIQEAKRKSRGNARFYVADAVSKNGIVLSNDNNAQKFDRAVFLFSIQDMDNETAAFKNVSDLLVQNGEMVIFMLHPIFRIPRMTGWGTDIMRKLTYRRIDIYRTTTTIPLPQYTERGYVTSFFYHRPLEKYIRSLSVAGFTLTNMAEIYSSDQKPESEFPHFLVIKAKKLNSHG